MNIKRTRKEKGIALLFAMGILSLMTVMALSLATLSLEKQDYAEMGSFEESAEALAVSLPERVKAQLSNYDDLQNQKVSSTTGLNKKFLPVFYSKTGGPNAVGEYSYDFDHIGAINSRELTLNNAIYAMDIMEYPDPRTKPNAIPNAPTWQYITNQDDENKLLARFAYVAIPAKPVINISSLYVKRDGSIIANTFVRNGNQIAGELDPAVLWADQRIYSQKEVNDGQFNAYKDEYEKFYDLPNLKKDFPSEGITDYDDLDKYILDNKFSDVGKRKEKLAFQKEFVNTFATDMALYPESFTLSDHPDAPHYHRISLPELSSRIAELTEETVRQEVVEKHITTFLPLDERKKLKALKDEGEEKKKLKIGFLNDWGETTYPITNKQEKTDTQEAKELSYPCIPWFSRIADKKLRYQLAANFLDFFTPVFTGKEGEEKSIYPTSDVLHDKWFETTPTYMGLKRAPYICGFGNEFEVALKVEKMEDTKQGSDSSATYNYKATLDIENWKHIIEIVNLYDQLSEAPEKTEDKKKNLQITVRGTITLKLSLNNTEKEVTLYLHKIQDGTITDYKKEEYLNPASSNRTFYTLFERNSSAETPVQSLTWEKINVDDTEYRGATPPAVSVKLLNVTMNTKAMLEWKHILPEKFKGNFTAIDFVDLTGHSYDVKNDDSSATILTTTADQAFATNYLCHVTRALDPRANLISSHWKPADNSVVYAGSDATFLVTANMHTQLPFYPEDWKYQADADEPSTIAVQSYDLPGSSVGEDFAPSRLTGLHRGAPLETFNFSTYKKDKEYPSSTGDTPEKYDTELQRNYSDGDLALLDQLKLTNNSMSPGKLNINLLDENNSFAFKALLRNSYNGADSGVEDKVQEFFKVDNFTDSSEIQKNPRRESPYYFRRGIDVMDLFKDLDPEKASAIMTRLAFLLDAEPTYLPRRVYVFGLAQILKENSTPSSTTWGTDDESMKAAGYLSSDEVKVTPYLRPQNTATDKKYDNMTDDILSEQQIFAILERTYTQMPYRATNKPVWKTIKVSYEKK